MEGETLFISLVDRAQGSFLERFWVLLAHAVLHWRKLGARRAGSGTTTLARSQCFKSHLEATSTVAAVVTFMILTSTIKLQLRYTILLSTTTSRALLLVVENPKIKNKNTNTRNS
jgi:hypothetical protein